MKKVLILGALLISFALYAESNVEECEEQEVETCIRYRMPPSFENSVIRDPIEREPIQQRPGNYESSFYEQMTR